MLKVRYGVLNWASSSFDIVNGKNNTMFEVIRNGVNCYDEHLTGWWDGGTTLKTGIILLPKDLLNPFKWKNIHLMRSTSYIEKY